MILPVRIFQYAAHDGTTHAPIFVKTSCSVAGEDVVAGGAAVVFDVPRRSELIRE